LNPLHNKFNKLECLEWIDGFNIVIKNCHRFIKNYATIIKLEWIDELDKDSLEKKMNKLKNFSKFHLSSSNPFILAFVSWV
jgi:hypothetical protein